MKNEIERKFLVSEMPDLKGCPIFHYERYIVKLKDGEEERVTKINNEYRYEKKIEISSLERSREVMDISEEEFNHLKKQASQVIVRDKYVFSESPHIAIQIYRGRFEGLARVEVEFETVDEAQAFKPLEWMGKEITGLPVARDGALFALTDGELKNYFI